MISRLQGLNLILSFVQLVLLERTPVFGWATGASEKSVTSQTSINQQISSSIYTSLRLSSTICTSPTSTTCSLKIWTSSEAPCATTKNLPLKNLLPSFEFPTPQPPSFQTASAHNCSSLPYHNSVPPQPRVISLHVHSVVVAIHSFLYNISHTPRERFPMHSHAIIMEWHPPQKETANKANLTSKIRKCSHWCGDLISCYTRVFKQAQPTNIKWFFGTCPKSKINVSIRTLHVYIHNI